MAYDLEEQEQIDQLRAWWAKYGSLVTTVLLIALVAIAGWRSWQWYQSHQAGQARGYFEALEEATRQPGDQSIARINAAAQTLRIDYGTTDYAGRGALVAAAALEARNDLPAARAQLEWLVQSKNPALVPVARLRLAGLLYEQKDYDAALGQLNDAPQAFAGLFEDRRGDIFAAQGKTAEARTVWAKAIEILGVGHPLISVIQLKLDALGA
jgi:predicted negative regulator of RcsB-dependent stress response